MDFGKNNNMKYTCTICGYIYDNDQEKIPFNELQGDYICPICGAPHSAFEEVKQNENKDISGNDQKTLDESLIHQETDLTELSNIELKNIFLSLKRAAQVSYLTELENLFSELANYYTSQTNFGDFDLSLLKEKIEDEKNLLQEASILAEKLEDNGAERALLWTTKVTSLVKSIINNIDNYQESKVYVCTICGFIYIGNELPLICPVCKVTNKKFVEVK